MFQNPVFRLGAEDMRVELDKKSLFALASDTRVEILRALQPMRRTVTQLSESLNIDKSAVHRHLKKMEEGGLVKRYEDHGFVYYGLSWKARDLMSPNENTKIVILLSCTWILVLVTAFLIAGGLFSGEGHSGLLPDKGPASYDTNPSPENSTGASTSQWVIWGMSVTGVGLLASVLGVIACRTWIRPKQNPATSTPLLETARDAPLDD